MLSYAVSVMGDLASLATLMCSALGCRDRMTRCVLQCDHDFPRHGVSLPVDRAPFP